MMATSAAERSTAPTVVRDPRFDAGRTLIQQGMANEGAIEIFSTLVEECIAKYGESSIETSPAFYEYGNALLRASLAESPHLDDDEEVDDDDAAKVSAQEARRAAGAAAEARHKAQIEGDKKLPSSTCKPSEESEKSKEQAVATNEEEEDDEDHSEEDEADDLRLSLEMMENAFSIMDEYKNKPTEQSSDEKINQSYLTWTREQLPRVLLGIGDCLSALQRHADAADAYSRALELRQEQLDQVAKSSCDSLEHLQSQRRVCEATVLVAEELLACPKDEDVVATETQSVIVKADERIEYARGYYDKARDSLQDTVFLMGKLASENMDLGTEKEDVCFLATMIMGVGETLAAYDEQEAEQRATEHVNKKPKTIE